MRSPWHHIEGCERDQSQLMPARVDDYVHAEFMMVAAGTADVHNPDD